MAAVVLAGVEDRSRCGCRTSAAARASCRKRAVNVSSASRSTFSSFTATGSPSDSTRAEHEPHPTLAEELLEAVPGDRVPGLELLGRQVPHRRASIRPRREAPTPSQNAKPSYRRDGNRGQPGGGGDRGDNGSGRERRRRDVLRAARRRLRDRDRLPDRRDRDLDLARQRARAGEAIGANYTAAEGSECLAGEFELAQSGEFVTLDGSGSTGGKLRLDGDQLTGDVTCADGTTQAATLTVTGAGEAPASRHDRRRADHGQLGLELPEPGASSKPPVKRSGEETFGRLMLAIAAVILAARLMGLLGRWASRR